MLAFRDLSLIKTPFLFVTIGLLVTGAPVSRSYAQSVPLVASSGSRTTVITLDEAIRRAQAIVPPAKPRLWVHLLRFSSCHRKMRFDERIFNN